MKSSTSTLNPFAQSYVPLAKREVKDEDQSSKSLPGEGGASGAVDDLKLKGQQVDDPHRVQSQNSGQMESKFTDEESEMDLAYLQMIFPGISNQSLLDVYNVNSGDLEAAVDMLDHLEAGADPEAEAAHEFHPDVQKPSPSGECSSGKVLGATGESSSASASSDLTVAT